MGWEGKRVGRGGERGATSAEKGMGRAGWAGVRRRMAGAATTGRGLPMASRKGALEASKPTRSRVCQRRRVKCWPNDGQTRGGKGPGVGQSCQTRGSDTRGDEDRMRAKWYSGARGRVGMASPASPAPGRVIWSDEGPMRVKTGHFGSNRAKTAPARGQTGPEYWRHGPRWCRLNAHPSEGLAAGGGQAKRF